MDTRRDRTAGNETTKVVIYIYNLRPPRIQVGAIKVNLYAGSYWRHSSRAILRESTMCNHPLSREHFNSLGIRIFTYFLNICFSLYCCLNLNLIGFCFDQNLLYLSTIDLITKIFWFLFYSRRRISRRFLIGRTKKRNQYFKRSLLEFILKISQTTLCYFL